MKLSKKAIDFGASMALVIAMLVLIIGVTVGSKVITDLKSGESASHIEYVVNGSDAADTGTHPVTQVAFVTGERWNNATNETVGGEHALLKSYTFAGKFPINSTLKVYNGTQLVGPQNYTTELITYGALTYLNNITLNGAVNENPYVFKNLTLNYTYYDGLMTGTWTHTTTCAPIIGSVYVNSTQDTSDTVNKTVTTSTGAILIRAYNWDATAQTQGKNLTIWYTCNGAAGVADYGNQGLMSFAGFLPIIGTIFAVFIVLGIVFAFKEQFTK